MRAAAFAVLTLALVAPPPGAAAPSPAAGEPHLLRYERREAVPGPPAAGAAAPRTHSAPATSGRSLARADFDGDGIQDVAAGLTRGGDGWVEFRPGRPIGASHPFGPAGEPHPLPGAADFLAAGDFDRDGRSDLVAASRSQAALWWLPGRGDGTFHAPIEVPLPGPATALAAGMIDVADGLDDLAVAVNGFAGTAVLLYRSTAPSFLEAPLDVPLATPAAALAIADVAGGPGRDVAVAAGDELLTVLGTDRLVRGRTEGRGEVLRLTLPFEARALATGDFLGRGSDHRDLAILAEDGRIEILHWLPETAAETGVLERRTTGEARWRRDTVSGLARRSAPAAGPFHLVSVRQEASAGDGLAVLGPGAGAAELIALQAVEGPAGIATKSGPGTPLRPLHRRRLPAPAPAAVLPATLNGDALTDLLVLAPSGTLEALATTTGTTFVVDSTGEELDDDIGDGVCRSSAGTCTLRAAVQESEALAGADTIHFAINPSAPAGIPRTIPYTTGNLPLIAGPVTIEGPNQGGAAVVLDGSQLASGSGVSAFRLGSAGSSVVIRNLTISGFPQAGLEVGGTGHIVEGNRLTGNGWAGGTNPVISVGGGSVRIGGSTSAARNVIVGSPGAAGIKISSTAGNGIDVLGNLIGIEPGGSLDPVSTGIRLERGAQVGSSTAGAGNVVVASFTGIHLDEADGAQIWGNSIGATADGAVVGTASNGLWIDGGDGILVGGAGIGLGNVVSGNASAGIRLTDQLSAVPPDNVSILGNRIGTDLSGTTAVPNGMGIFALDAWNLTVGGAGSAGNVISGNTGGGITMADGVSIATLRGNYVGTDADGFSALPNGTGISAYRPEGLVIGGAGAGEGNLVSGNGGTGIRLQQPSGDLIILGNRIGVRADGGPRGNLGPGIRIEEASGAKVGGPSAPNEIAHNTGAGIHVTWGWGVDIRANSIYSNSGLGIDLGDGTLIADGVTTNDPGDADIGPNDRQNFPLIDAVFTDGIETRVYGRLESLPNLDYRIDVFANASCEPSGHGEGRTYLGAATVEADSAGTAQFALTVPSVVLPGFPVTATATRVSPGNTSELSACAASETCSAGEDDRVLTAETLSGTQTLEACRSITAHGGVEITGDVTFQAGRRIVLGDGFSVGPGGSFAAVVEVP